MFEQFTERARQVIVLAQDAARALKHNYLGTEHICSACSASKSVWRRVVESFDVTI